MNQYHTEGRRALLLLYDIVIGLAIAKALELCFVKDGAFALPNLQCGLLFLALLSYVFRFFLGSHKVMARDIELEVRRGKLVIDVIILLGQAIGFFVAALCFQRLDDFRLTVTVILCFEVLWLGVLFAFFRVRGRTEKQWLWHDAILVVLLSPAVLNAPPSWLGFTDTIFWFAWWSIVAAVVDLTYNADFYFPRIGRPLRIFIAGPYGDHNPPDMIAKNVTAAEELGKQIALKGHIPFIPHTMLDGWQKDSRFQVNDFKRIDREWLEQCDALYFIAPSPGASEEKGIAEHRGLRVFRSLDDVPRYEPDHNRRSQKVAQKQEAESLIEQ